VGRLLERMRSDRTVAVLLVLPSLIAVGIFVYGFIGWTGYVSLSRWSGLIPDYHYVGTSNYERFLYAAQSTVDSGDPVNFASTLAALDMPVLLVQINGDTVIPNSADSAPLAGTAPMAELLGAEPLSVGATQLGQGFVRMTAGGHSSLLRPEGGAPQVTGEMHAQVVSFVLQDAEVVVGQVAPDNIE
jgi:ABC-type sugar transport system permease subunit